jgi:ethanolamine permease
MENDRMEIAVATEPKKEHHLLKVLGPMHIWGLGVGIVLVGEFMGWNFAVGKGGTLGSILACWVVGILFITLIMINTEIGSVIPEAGGQYAMAKYLMGPLVAFNIGLMLVFEYVMLEAADSLVVGTILQSLNPAVNPLPYVLLIMLALTYLNYKGVHATMNLNFVLTAIAFITILVLLFAMNVSSVTTSLVHIGDSLSGLPYGIIGVIGAMQFAIWFYLGIEGTALAAEECKSTARSLPIGAIVGMITLLIGATITWFVCSSLISPTELGKSTYPLFDAAVVLKNPIVTASLFLGTVLACIASANGCITDASRAWFSMSRDTLIPDTFAVLHPKYKTPYRAILFLLPIAVAFGLAGLYTGLLDQIVTFSIQSALIVYLIVGIMMFKFRKMYPMGTINRGYTAPLHPLPAIVLIGLVGLTIFGMYFGYWINLVAGFVFYFAASLWFTLHRYKFVDFHKFISTGKDWPRPKGY